MAGAVVALSLAGCGPKPGAFTVTGTGTGAGRSVPARDAGTADTTSAGTVSATGTATATATATAKGRPSSWKLEDLSRAEGRQIYSEVQNGDQVIAPKLSATEQDLLERLEAAPPGASIKDPDLVGDHLRRVKMEVEFVYGRDGSFSRAMWRYENAKGKTIGYRVHSQPADLLSGKYVIAFYGGDSKLLMAYPIWY
jgi:hypothetical protein